MLLREAFQPSPPVEYVFVKKHRIFRLPPNSATGKNVQIHHNAPLPSLINIGAEGRRRGQGGGTQVMVWRRYGRANRHQLNLQLVVSQFHCPDNCSRSSKLYTVKR